MELTKRDIYVLIETHRRSGISASETYRIICSAWGDDVISERRVQEIAKEFSSGSRVTFERKSSSRKSEERQNLVAVIEQEISIDPRLSCRKLAAKYNICHQKVYRIITEDLQLKSVQNRLVPYNLTDAIREKRINCCREFLQIATTRNIKRRLIHSDEKWFYCSPIGSPSTNRAWITPGGDVPTCPRRTPMDKKFMVMVAINFEGLSFYRVLEPNETVDSDCYMKFLNDAFASFSTYELRQARTAVLWENSVIQHDNARPHVSSATKRFIEVKNGFLLPQAPYSPDTNILDRFLFPKLEMERCEITFRDRGELKEFLNEALNRLTPRMMAHQFDQLKSHCQKIIDNNGSYV